MSVGKHSVMSGRIIAGAESAFRRLGVPATRVEDILTEAGVSRRTFYQHFGGKDDVAAALWARSLADLVQRLRDRLDAAMSPTDAMAGALDVYVTHWARNGPVMRDLFVDSLWPGSRLAPARQRSVRTVVTLLTEGTGQGGRGTAMAVKHFVLGLEALLVHHMGAAGLSSRAAEGIRGAMRPLAEHLVHGDSVGAL
jgi:AcrR family transcriptional regulator